MNGGFTSKLPPSGKVARTQSAVANTSKNPPTLQKAMSVSGKAEQKGARRQLSGDAKHSKVQFIESLRKEKTSSGSAHCIPCPSNVWYRSRRPNTAVSKVCSSKVLEDADDPD